MVHYTSSAQLNRPLVVECPGCGVQETLDFTQGHPICDVCGFSMDAAEPRTTVFQSLAAWLRGRFDRQDSSTRGVA